MIDESLLTNGWLTAESIALQQVEPDAAVKCHLIANARKFSEVVFGTNPEKEPRPAICPLCLSHRSSRNRRLT